MRKFSTLFALLIILCICEVANAQCGTAGIYGGAQFRSNLYGAGLPLQANYGYGANFQQFQTGLGGQVLLYQNPSLGFPLYGSGYNASATIVNRGFGLHRGVGVNVNGSFGSFGGPAIINVQQRGLFGRRTNVQVIH